MDLSYNTCAALVTHCSHFPQDSVFESGLWVLENGLVQLRQVLGTYLYFCIKTFCPKLLLFLNLYLVTYFGQVSRN